ncbi:unnamed protein product, partial [Prorocentrum cordatum]
PRRGRADRLPAVARRHPAGGLHRAAGGLARRPQAGRRQGLRPAGGVLRRRR